MNGSAIPAATGAIGGCLMGAVAPQASSYSLSWAGPFTPGEVYYTTEGKQFRVTHASNPTATLTEMNSLAHSDPIWWVIVG